MHSVPSALWAFLSTQDDPEEAIVRAVNMGGDADSIGAIAGAIAGRDYFSEGRTLRRCGIEGMDADSLIEYAQSGAK